MRRIDFGFWAKIALTSLFVNVPLAFAMVVYGLHPAVAFGFSAIAGMGTLLIWDGRRAEAQDDRAEAIAVVDVVEGHDATAKPMVTLRTRELAKAS